MRLANALAFALLMLTALPALAADPYLVRDIKVDVTAANAVAARDEAMMRAQREGLTRLMQRLTADAAPGSLPNVGSLDIDQFVRSIDVQEEQLAATRYIATLAVSYDADAIDELLQRTSAPVVLGSSKPLLVVPAVDSGNGVEVWGDNPWLQAWRAGDVGTGLVDVRVPNNDPLDEATLPSAAVAAADEAALQRLAERYGAEAAVLLVARPEGVIEAPRAVDVRLLRSWDWDATDIDQRVVASGEEGAYAAAARRVATRLEQGWKRDNVVRLDRLESLSVRVLLAGLRDWVQIRRGMEGLSEIRETRIERLSQTEATLTIRYVGSRSQLLRALSRQGLRLSEELDGWRLQRAAVQEERPLHLFG